MRYQLQQHIAATFGAKQRVFPEAFEETLCEWFVGQHTVSSGVIGHIGRDALREVFSDLLVPDISVEPVITNSLKSLWQYMLYHSCDELDGREGFVFNLSCFMVTIPVADGFSVISFNSSYRDRRRYYILCQILSQSFSARWNFSVLQKSDKAFGIISPGSVNVFFNVRIGNILPEHFQEMVLPFFVHHIVWDVTNRFPFAFFIKPSMAVLYEQL